jgi:hypothetical protein
MLTGSYFNTLNVSAALLPRLQLNLLQTCCSFKTVTVQVWQNFNCTDTHSLPPNHIHTTALFQAGTDSADSTPLYLHSMAQVCAGTSNVISWLAWSLLHHRVYESTSTTYATLMWTAAKTIHTYIHESTLLCSYIQRNCEGITAWWDRRLCPIAAVYLKTT